MVWYQKFEYAIGHWLQKAAEHILGCVVRHHSLLQSISILYIHSLMLDV